MLLGRAAEMEQIAQLVDGAREGRGGSILFEGDPGIGKTSLLEEATATDGIEAIRVTGIEAEANLPYAALGEAVTPVLDRLDRLPAPQAEALETALALGTSQEAARDRFAVCAAFLGLLTEAAREQPLLVLVDDAQWLDSSSDECFAYAARRLKSSRVALVAAARKGSDGLLANVEPADRIELSGLSSEDARSLLEEAVPDASIGVFESLVDSAGGNPLALRELPAALSDDQRSGRVPIEVVPATTEALVTAFRGRFEALDAPARGSVEVASAAFDRELVPVVAACRDLSIEPNGLEAAETAGILAIGENSISFSHPLLKAVVYNHTAPPDRRRAHRALAAHSGPDARAWHLAAGTLGADPEVAESLEKAAGRATVRGAYSVAVDAMHRAAEFTDEPDDRTRKLYGAATAAMLAGDYDRCASLLELGSEVEDPLLRARIRHALAVVKMPGGIGLAPGAHGELSREAELVADRDPSTAAAMFADAGLLAGTAGRFSQGLEAIERARAVLPGDASRTVRCQIHAMSAISTALTGRAAEASEDFETAGRLLSGVDVISPAVQSIVLGLHGMICSGQEAILKAELDRLVAMASESDVFGLLPYLLTLSSDVAFRTGDWESSARDSRSVELAEEYGQAGILPFSLAVRGRLLAARGQSEQARQDLESGASLAREHGEPTVENIGRAGLGFLELGAGRTEESIQALEEVKRFAGESKLEDPVYIPWAPDLIEAYMRAGQGDDAVRLSADLDRRAGNSGAALALALAARCRGLVRETGFEKEFEQALNHHERAEAPFEAARTLLLYGLRLHRARRRVEGRDRLRAALAIFEDLGASPWIAQAKRELTAAGAIRREPAADPDELSPQEIRVARAVAAGATNREVAAQMYLSPKTIEFHLGRVYRKLDIHSRTELATLAAKGELEKAGDGVGSALLQDD
jgi:DNA-binding CsgD family transcriptional regulator